MLSLFLSYFLVRFALSSGNEWKSAKVISGHFEASAWYPPKAANRGWDWNVRFGSKADI